MSKTLTLRDFSNKIINGCGGFKSMEEHEFAVFSDRDCGISDFVINCLANPDCEGSEVAIQAILERRARLKQEKNNRDVNPNNPT